MAVLAPLDYAVLVAYGALVLAIGTWAHRRQKTTEDYLLGGRRLPWWAVGVSLIATSFSSIALVAYTGMGFTRGVGYLQTQLGDLLAIGAVCVLFLPFFARLRLTTAYEYLERRFGVATRTVASLLFVGQTLARAGILVLVPAVAVSSLLGWDLRWAIAASGLAAVLYSTAGGIAAVVWTDLIQMAVVVFGVAFSLVVLAGDVAGGVGALAAHAAQAGRLDVVDASLALDRRFTLLWSVLAYGVLAFSVAGTNQQAVQRYLSCRDLSGARRAALLGWGIGFVAVVLTFLLGAFLAAWSELAPAAEGFRAAFADGGGRGDQALPLFIGHRLPAGVSGLLVAAIFAASMSSMDSAIHSLSTATLVDFVRRFGRRPPSAASELRLARVLTAVFGVAATALAVVAARAGTQILDTLLTWLGYFAGPLLGLFLTGLLVRRANEPGALLGVGLAGGGVLGCVLGDVPARAGFDPLWLAPASCAATLLLGAVLSRLGPPPAPSRLEGLVAGAGRLRSGSQ